MIALNNQELETLCSYLYSNIFIFQPLASRILEDCYYTGARPQELIQQDRWTWVDNTQQQFLMQPQKGNAVRIIDRSIMSNIFIANFINNQKPYNGLTVRRAEYYMKQFNPAGRMAVGNRDVTMYIFRYNHVNSLRMQGWTWEEIQIYFGWYNALMPFSYAERNVFVSNYPIVYPP